MVLSPDILISLIGYYGYITAYPGLLSVYLSEYSTANNQFIIITGSDLIMKDNFFNDDEINRLIKQSDNQNCSKLIQVFDDIELNQILKEG